MGLDIVIYRKEAKNEVYEIKEALHKAMFNRSIDLSEMSKLNAIRDYYKTDVFFQPDDIARFIDDLNKLDAVINPAFREDIKKIIDKLSDNKIVKIHIGGD